VPFAAPSKRKIAEILTTKVDQFLGEGQRFGPIDGGRKKIAIQPRSAMAAKALANGNAEAIASPTNAMSHRAE
jgi:hypothetical protein